MNTGKHKLVDRFGRVHDYLRISLTERCNLRCTYCMPAEGIQLRDRAEFMSSEELLVIANQFVQLGVKKIRLTGGEPLIKKNFEQILEGLSKLNVELAITTNGVLLDKYLDKLWSAGIRTLNISLDSLNKEQFNNISRRNYFERIIDNINLCIATGFEVKINVVVMRGVNDDEIIEFVKWTTYTPVNVRFIEFMPFDGNQWNWKSKVSMQEILDKVFDYFHEKNIIKLNDAANSTSSNYQVIGGLGSFGIISSMTNPFCDSCNRIRLTADGKIKNCLFSQEETDLLTLLRNGHESKLKDSIIHTIESKHKERGGISDFEELDGEDVKNRTMVSIGG